MPWVAWGTSVNHSIFFRQTVTARGEYGERVRQTREEREKSARDGTNTRRVA